MIHHVSTFVYPGYHQCSPVAAAGHARADGPCPAAQHAPLAVAPAAGRAVSATRARWLASLAAGAASPAAEAVTLAAAPANGAVEAHVAAAAVAAGLMAAVVAVAGGRNARAAWITGLPQGLAGPVAAAAVAALVVAASVYQGRSFETCTIESSVARKKKPVSEKRLVLQSVGSNNNLEIGSPS